MLNIMNSLTNKHTKAALNSTIPKTTGYIDEVMLNKHGLKIENRCSAKG